MRYRLNRYDPTLLYEPTPGIIIGANAEDLVSAADRGAGVVESLGKSPLGLAVPQLAAAAATAATVRRAIKAAKAGQLDDYIASLSKRTADGVTSFLRSIF